VVGHYEINPLKIIKWGHFKDSKWSLCTNLDFSRGPRHFWPQNGTRDKWLICTNPAYGHVTATYGPSSTLEHTVTRGSSWWVAQLGPHTLLLAIATVWRSAALACCCPSWTAAAWTGQNHHVLTYHQNTHEASLVCRGCSLSP
jgi:hypothetical protein